MSEQENTRKDKAAAVVIGVSAGGLMALKRLLGELPADFPLPILIVQHLSPDVRGGPAEVLAPYCALMVKEADEGETLAPGTVYFAPANYHLLVERDRRLALSTDPPENFARPSVDVLFESAAEVFGPALIGVILTGANHDGSRGLERVKQLGGLAIIQDPADAEVAGMPRAALERVQADYVSPLAGLAGLLGTLVGDARAGNPP